MVKLFFSYSHKDTALRDQLETHLAMLKHQSIIETWHDAKIIVGDQLDLKINKHLNSADIVLFLVSPDFLASAYCYGIEVKRAMQLHRRGKLRVIPVILRACEWHEAPFGRLKAAPKDGKPIRSWSDRDRAFLDVAQSIRNAAAEIKAQKDKQAVPAQSGPRVSQGYTLLPSAERPAARARRDTSTKDKAIRQLWRMVEASNDMYRQRDDMWFSEGGGRIEYVFDENVFELFARPKFYRDYASTFYSAHWPLLPGASESDRINSQTALITSEYLFSGKLPGQIGKRFHMTEWHYGELGERIFSIMREASSAASHLVLPTEVYLGELRDLADLDLDKRLNETQVEDDLDVSIDLRELRNFGVGQGALRQYLWTRYAAQALADDDGIECLRQIQRIFSGGIIEHFVPFGTTSSAMDNDIARDANAWMVRLLEEQRYRRHLPLSVTKSRQKASLWNDAKSLALVCHAARYNELGVRTVLVTGDTLMFDAYRRWYMSTDDDDEPFVLRRISQFVPLLNLHGMRRSSASALGAIVDAVDIALTPFNLQRSERRTPRQLFLGREYFALRVAGLDRSRRPLSEIDMTGGFLEGVSKEWAEGCIEHFSALGMSCQRVERATIGDYHELIQRRLDTLPSLGFDLSNDAEIAGWLSKLLDDIAANARKIWEHAEPKAATDDLAPGAA